jgi:hypothetical protein
VVVDWANAGRGDSAADVAVTWALLASGEVPTGPLFGAVLGRFRASLLHAFLAGVDREAARGRLAAAVAWKVGDANLSTSERASLRRLAVDEGVAG